MVGDDVEQREQHTLSPTWRFVFGRAARRLTTGVRVHTYAVKRVL
jgi:hypothetical protein